MRNVPFDVEPLSGALGAVLHGVDLARLDDELFAAIEKAWLKYLVVFFVDQELTPEQQIAFARRLGDIHYHPYMQGLDEHPEILEIVKNRVRHIPSDPSGTRTRCLVRNPRRPQCCTPRRRLQQAATHCLPICI